MPVGQDTQSKQKSRMIAKVHIGAGGRKIVAVCDDNLIGKRYEEKGLQLDLCSLFYKGVKKTEKEILDMLNGPCILNIVGKESIDLALKQKLIEKKHILIISEIPHAQAIIN
jgi:hypothetical protein